MLKILTRDEFLSGYWAQYHLLEKEFMATIPFVSLDPKNEETFSNNYLKLILEICSETEVALRMYCNMINSNFNISENKYYSIKDYKKQIKENISEPDFKDFVNKKIQFIDNRYKPRLHQFWLEWEKEISPSWWTTYNKVKHRRMDKGKISENETEEQQEFYKFANQKHVLSALGGLYQVLSFVYKHIAQDMKMKNPEEDFIFYPTPKSELFKPIFDELLKKNCIATMMLKN